MTRTRGEEGEEVRRTRRGGATKARVEAIVWLDAEGHQRKKYRAGLIALATIGTPVYEDDDEVILATEIEYAPDFATEETDHVKIPKVLILARYSLGEFPMYRSVEALKESLSEAQTTQKE